MLRKISFLLLVAVMAWLTTMHAVGQKQSDTAEEEATIETITADVTGYTSSADETDDTPEITASGTRTHKGTVACPRRYPFGTRVLIEGTAYVCEDRMNIRYDDRFDIWMESKEEAILWGVRTLQVTILQHE